MQPLGGASPRGAPAGGDRVIVDALGVQETRLEGSEARRLGAEFKLSYHLLLLTGTVPGSAGWVPSVLTLTDMLAKRQQCGVRVSKRSPSHRQVTWA